MKHCYKCGQNKDLIEFGKDKYKPDGLNSYCKGCIKKRSAKQRTENPLYMKEYAPKYRENNRETLREKARFTFKRDKEKRLEQGKRSYYKYKTEIARRRAIKRRTPEGLKKSRERAAEWRKRTGNAIKYVTRWRKDNPEKAAIHSLILWAVRAKILTRKENCEECGLKCKTQGHHKDYSKPLDVVWLCPRCHGEKHRTYR